MVDWLLLAIHAVAAALLVRTVIRSVAPALASPAMSHGSARGLMTDLWLPIALIGPLIALAARPVTDVPQWSGRTVAPAVGFALLAVGAVALGVSRRLSLRGALFPLLMLALVGAVTLLLASANRLSIGVGQTLFASAVVLLWVNTPRVPPHGSEPHVPGGLLVILILSAAQAALTALMRTDEPLRLATGVVVLQGAMTLGILARHSPLATLSIGAWAAVYGAMLCVGMVSVARLVRATWFSAGGSDGDDRILQAASFGVATGFAHLAIEGSLLILAALGVAGATHLRGAPRIVLGLAALVTGGALIGWRLSATPT